MSTGFTEEQAKKEIDRQFMKLMDKAEGVMEKLMVRTFLPT